MTHSDVFYSTSFKNLDCDLLNWFYNLPISLKTRAKESPNLIEVSLPLLSSSHFIIKTPLLSYCKGEVSRTQRSLRYELLNMQIFCKSFLQMCEFPQGTRGFPAEHMKQGHPLKCLQEPDTSREWMMWLVGGCWGSRWDLRGHMQECWPTVAKSADFSRESPHLDTLMQNVRVQSFGN